MTDICDMPILCELPHIMNAYFVNLYRHRQTIVAFILFSFTCAFLHLQNFDPTHPTQMNVSCIQGLPQCASYNDTFSSIVNTLIFFSGLCVLVFVCKQVFDLNIKAYIEDFMYVPILLDPISFGMRTGIVHAKYH